MEQTVNVAQIKFDLVLALLEQGCLADEAKTKAAMLVEFITAPSDDEPCADCRQTVAVEAP